MATNSRSSVSLPPAPSSPQASSFLVAALSHLLGFQHSACGRDSDGRGTAVWEGGKGDGGEQGRVVEEGTEGEEAKWKHGKGDAGLTEQYWKTGARKEWKRLGRTKHHAHHKAHHHSKRHSLRRKRRDDDDDDDDDNDSDSEYDKHRDSEKQKERMAGRRKLLAVEEDRVGPSKHERATLDLQMVSKRCQLG